METKKLIAAFLLFMVVLSSEHIPKVEASKEMFPGCFDDCIKECEAREAVNDYEYCAPLCRLDCDMVMFRNRKSVQQVEIQLQISIRPRVGGPFFKFTARIELSSDSGKRERLASLVDVHSRTWLLSAAFCFAARFGFDRAESCNLGPGNFFIKLQTEKLPLSAQRAVVQVIHCPPTGSNNDKQLIPGKPCKVTI